MLLGAGHPDVEQVEGDDEALEFSALWKAGAAERPRRALRIERVRELIRVMATRPSQATYRIATLDGSTVQDTAASALLKLFEEPPSRAVLLLRAASVDALPPPIASRCQVVRLGAVPADTIADWLQTIGKLSAAEARAYAMLSGGRPGLARRLSESSEARGALDAHATLWIEIVHADTVTKLDQAAVWGRNYATARAALDLAALVWHTLIQHAATGATPVSEAFPLLPAFQRGGATAAIASGVAVLGKQLAAIARASRLLDANVQPRLALEWLLLEFSSITAA